MEDQFENDQYKILNEFTGLLETVGESDDGYDNEEVLGNNKKRKINKELRVLGKKYGGHKARAIKDKNCEHLAEKKRKRSYLCGAVDDDCRKNAFRYFWKLPSWDEKKSYIKGLVENRKTYIRQRLTSKRSIQNNRYDCFLPSGDGQRVRVCKNFFVGTFGLSMNLFECWFKTKDKKVVDKKTIESKSESLYKWLEQIPKVPSHYCRYSTKRVYVDQDFVSKSHMHRIYIEWCKGQKETAVMRKKFCEVLQEQNISIFKPRKDQCDLCVGFKEGNVADEEYSTHIAKKDEAKAAKQTAIDQMSEETMVLTMDMQSVLLCPKLLVSEQYYKTKLALHNFSFYVKNTKDVRLYVWHEGEGGVSANNITSCIIHFLKNNCLSYKKVILISDGCTYQNKNKVLSSALANLNTTTGIEIEQLILEKGHTMMEVDSVHSTLEMKFKPPIYTPMDYITRMRQARPSQPYEVNHLDHTFFKDYENVPGNFTSIRPGKLSGEATVNNIRAMLYKDNKVQFKLRHSEEWKNLPQKRDPKKQPHEIGPLYAEQPKIEESKYKSLQSLKKYMHKDFHAFYDNLHY